MWKVLGTVWRGCFCPCVLFGHNVEKMKDDVQWTTPCICHAIFVEGGIALGCATLALHGLNPKAVFLIGEGLIFAWWMCGVYTGLFRQELQRKYHLQVIITFSFCFNLKQLLFV